MSFARLNHWLIGLILVFVASSCYRLDINELVKSTPLKPMSFDDGAMTSSLTSAPTFSWVAPADRKRKGFQVAVGTTPGASDTVAWTDVGETTSAKLAIASGLSGGSLYYGSVRAVGLNGNISEAAVGAGFAYLPPPTYVFDFVSNDDMIFDPHWITSQLTSAGSYYDKNGIIRYSSPNYLNYSEDFSSGTWSKTYVTSTIPGTVVTPSESLLASRIAPAFTAFPQTHSTSQNITTTAGKTYALSMYLQAGGYSAAKITMSGTFTSASVTVDLSGGTVLATTGSPAVLPKVTSVGNGWYRAEIASTATGTGSGITTLTIVSDLGATSFNGDVSKAIYAWGAQIEDGMKATSYVPTTNVRNYLPRIDHDPSNCPGGRCTTRGFLMEQTRTNITMSSEDFSDASRWVTGSVNVTPNSSLAPDSFLTADTLTETGAAPSIAQLLSTSVAGGVYYTNSVFVKPNGRTRVQLALWNTVSDGFSSVFDLTGAGSSMCTTMNGASTSASAKIVSLPNGWYRIEIRGKLSASSSTGVQQISLVNSDCNTSYTGDGVSGVFLWGAQVENGFGASSYVPGGFTRGADNLYHGTISSFVNQTNGAVVVDQMPIARASDTNAFYGAIRLADLGTAYMTHKIEIYGQNTYYGGSVYNSPTYWFLNFPLPQAIDGTSEKMGFSYAPTVVISAGKGVIGTPDAVGVTLPNFAQIQIPGGAFEHIRTVKYWNSTLSRAQLQRATQ